MTGAFIAGCIVGFLIGMAHGRDQCDRVQR